MSYEFQIKTGDSTLSGCRLVADYSNLPARVFDDRFIVATLENGEKSLVSLNGQTLSQGEVSEIVLPFVSFKETDGEYWMGSGSSFKNGYFEKDFSTAGFSFQDVIYDIRGSGAFAIFESAVSGQFNTGIEAAIASNITYKSGDLSSLDFYMNGQKLYSGESYTITGSNNRFNLIQPFTGKLFAVERASGFSSLNSENPDFYGTKFIESNCNYYWNGLEQNPISWIETNTGVKTIATGKSSNLQFDTPVYEEYKL